MSFNINFINHKKDIERLSVNKRKSIFDLLDESIEKKEKTSEKINSDNLDQKNEKKENSKSSCDLSHFFEKDLITNENKSQSISKLKSKDHNTINHKRKVYIEENNSKKDIFIKESNNSEYEKYSQINFIREPVNLIINEQQNGFEQRKSNNDLEETKNDISETKSKPIIKMPLNIIKCQKPSDDEETLSSIEEINQNNEKENFENENEYLMIQEFYKNQNNNNDILNQKIYSDKNNTGIKAINQFENGAIQKINYFHNNKIYNEKPKYTIPIAKIKKEIEDKNNKNKIQNNDNIKNYFRSNFYYGIKSNLPINQNYYYNFPRINNPSFSNNNVFESINNISKIYHQKMLFQQARQLGMYYLTYTQNINNYIVNLYNNNANNNCNNPFIQFNNNEFYYKNSNYNNLNYYGNQNPLLNILNNNLPNNSNNNINRNKIENLKYEKNIKIVRSKTNDPHIDKITKITQFITYSMNDNQKIKQENQPKKIKEIINLEDIKTGKERRTVIRLNPIPSKFSSFEVSKLLDKYLKIESGKNQRIYKALYTPLCKKIGKNKGYCFVMMVKPKYVIDFYNTFNGIIFGKKKCKSPCNLIWSHIQGDDFLNFYEEDPIKKPIIFKDVKID